MGIPSEISFRRFLLLRLVLLSLPVLLIGVLSYRKARSGLLETARQNLTESAVRKGASITASISAIGANLLTASQASSIQSGSLEEIRIFLDRLAARLPRNVRCIELKDLQTDRIEASTCDTPLPLTVPDTFWPVKARLEDLDEDLVYVKTALSDTQELESDSKLS
ncbi:two-component sensor histidine kinase, partial [Oscillatoriales cyanobacterium LEGE 11467]|nr:two-component sensor histidine kinase [Zarconia navalis LEGE 11467]